MNVVNVLGITAGSSIQARACPANIVSALGITFTAPPHSLQVSMYPRAPSLDASHQFTLSILKTRFSRPLMGPTFGVPNSLQYDVLQVIFQNTFLQEAF